jgi:hypothetical protein
MKSMSISAAASFDAPARNREHQQFREAVPPPPPRSMKAKRRSALSRIALTIGIISVLAAGAVKSQPDPDEIAERGDIRNLPDPLKARIVKLAERPHTYVPLRVFAEAASPSTLFQYYLLDTGGFEPNVFTKTIVGINDGVAPTATGSERRPADDRVGASRRGTEARSADGSERSRRIHRCLHRHLGFVRHQ